MSLIEPKTPPGVMELLPKEQIAFQRFIDTIRRGYERFGFLPIETPVFERLDVLLTKSGGETEKQVYVVQSTGSTAQGKEAELALRFDLTVPLARYVAQHEGQLVFPFRRYQIQRVYRGERAQRGRFREFYQCDIDVIGKDTLPIAYDAEMPAVIANVFRELQVGAFTIHLNNRKMLTGLFEGYGITQPERQAAAMREIDKLGKIGNDKVLEALSGPELSLSADEAGRLLSALSISGTNAEVLAALRAMPSGSALFKEGVDELEAVVEGLKAMQVPEENYRVNPSIARGLDYYTGTVYETFLNDFPALGSVCSGGRYGSLAEHYTRSKLPGVGISIGATRLFFQLKEAGIIKTARSISQVLVTQLDASLGREYLGIAATLRSAGINTEVHMEGGKFAKQLKYADRAGIRFAVLMGSDEQARGAVTVKDLQQGKQHEVARSELVAKLQELLMEGGG